MKTSQMPTIVRRPLDLERKATMLGWQLRKLLQERDAARRHLHYAETALAEFRNNPEVNVPTLLRKYEISPGEFQALARWHNVRIRGLRTRARRAATNQGAGPRSMPDPAPQDGGGRRD